MFLAQLFESIDEINVNTHIFSLSNVLQQKDMASVEWWEIKFSKMHVGTDDKCYNELELLAEKDLN